jgi:hypothetical protein
MSGGGELVSLCAVTELTTTLYRPVGQAELDLIRAGGFREFPPRLPEPPIFYPLLAEEHAIEIARDWNTKAEHSSFVGGGLRFEVRTGLLQSYDVHTRGKLGASRMLDSGGLVAGMEREYC